MSENYFVLPFLAGTVYLFAVLLYRGFRWINGLSRIDKLRLLESLRTGMIFLSVKEIFAEGLLHVSIFKKNKVLGYMHCSLAFGWFLLIVVGHFETQLARNTFFVPFYEPIFFRYFAISPDLYSPLFAFTMDMLLAVVLSGLSLAVFKRFKKKPFGLKRTTRLRSGDRIALSFLWFIFPFRLLAESVTAGLYHNGSFLTNGLGNLLAHTAVLEHLQLPLWTAYSVTLGAFFIALPHSRYMHIPTEILFIFVRNSGIKLKKRNNTYTDIQVQSCSRCGICLDNCQMTSAGIRDMQSVYLLKNIRNNKLDDEQLFNCLLCGKCRVDCPVKIETVDLRITQRIESTRQYNSSYDYLQTKISKKADIVYFAGCMTHLTPGIVQAMQTIFEKANADYWFLDSEKAPCCGRPLMLAGQYEAASKLIKNNTEAILNSGAETLVVSCPICYKVFKQDYELPGVEVITHIEYILRLLEQKQISVKQSNQRIVYHDPCELGRGCNIYEPPRSLIKQTGQLIAIENEYEKSFCCGGSLGNLKIKQEDRNKITNQALNEYLQYKPDILITACPLCKKTFSRNKNILVQDIAELIVSRLQLPNEFVRKVQLKKENELELITESE